MLYFMCLFLAALCGWTVGRSVGGKGLGAGADILLGITGAMIVRFLFDALQVSGQGIVVFLCSLSGAAAVPALVELLIGRRKRRASARSLRTNNPDRTKAA